MIAFSTSATGRVRSLRERATELSRKRNRRRELNRLVPHYCADNFDSLGSLTGNLFMDLAQGYMAVKPVVVAEGNHEACGSCLQDVPEIPYSAGNFTQYKSRFHSVSLNSNTGNNRYYSVNRGLAHFLVFTAESFVYSVSDAFNDNMVAFMKADLAAVDRKVTPWVIALVHKDWTMQVGAGRESKEGSAHPLASAHHSHSAPPPPDDAAQCLRCI